MGPITIDDAAWYTTFPHLVEPRENEWLAGLLLRCDEVNHWQCGDTLAILLDASHRRLLTRGVGLLKREHLEKLASALAVPFAAIVATSYQAELARFSDGTSRPLAIASSPPKFHICPLCVAQDRVLPRTLTLPGVTHCPQHQVLLVSSCQCGKPLLPFGQQTAPFTCGGCGLDWARLPGVQPVPAQVEAERTLLSYYAFFLADGSPALLASALRLIAGRQGTAERKGRSRLETALSSLEHLVASLMACGLSSQDVQLSQDHPSSSA